MKSKMELHVIKCNSTKEALAILANLQCVKESKCEGKNHTLEKEVSSVGINLEYILHRIATKKGWRFEKVNGWLGSIYDTSPIAAFNIVAREIAVLLDEKYSDHIENSEKIFSISPLDGRIHELCKAHIKNYRNFAAFRTMEDAKIACAILKGPLKMMFSNNAQGK